MDLKRDISESPPKRPVRARTGEFKNDQVPLPSKPVAPRPVPTKRGRNTPDEGGRKAHMPNTLAERAASRREKVPSDGATTRSTTAGVAPESRHVCNFYEIDQK